MKPIIKPINAFDATKANDIYFIYNGNQPQKNTLTIKKNSDNTQVYNATQTTMLLKHSIPANTLTNGTLYKYSIRSIDSSNGTSDASDYVLAYCYSEPTFTLNVSANQVISASNYDFTITYSQSQGEELQSYKLIIEDVSGNEVYNSGLKYGSDMTFTVRGFLNNTSYKVRATGTTVNGMALDTGYVQFTIQYETNDNFFTCDLQNDYIHGVVNVMCNIVSIEGRVVGNITFVNNTAVKIPYDSLVIFDSDFTISGDFSFQITGFDFAYDKTLVLLGSDVGNLSVKLKKYDSTDDYIEVGIYQTEPKLSAIYNTSNFVHKTSAFPVTITRINNLYTVEVGS